jgi:hypothetical protein
MINSKKVSRLLASGTFLAGLFLFGCAQTPKPLTPVTANDPEMKALDADRAKYREKKVALIEKALNLSASEHDAFWKEYSRKSTMSVTASSVTMPPTTKR